MKSTMEVRLLRANIGDAEELHAVQIKAFKELLAKFEKRRQTGSAYIF